MNAIMEFINHTCALATIIVGFSAPASQLHDKIRQVTYFFKNLEIGRQWMVNGYYGVNHCLTFIKNAHPLNSAQRQFTFLSQGLTAFFQR